MWWIKIEALVLFMTIVLTKVFRKLLMIRIIQKIWSSPFLNTTNFGINGISWKNQDFVKCLELFIVKFLYLTIQLCWLEQICKRIIFWIEKTDTLYWMTWKNSLIIYKILLKFSLIWEKKLWNKTINYKNPMIICKNLLTLFKVESNYLLFNIN